MPGGEEAPMGTDRDALRALAGQGIDLPAAVEALTRLAIETPSWGYGNSGTRFAVFPWPGAARTVWEKLEDAALVHRLTGICPSVAIHIPWDRVDDWQRLVVYAAERGVRVGAVNPNVFQDDVYRLGSVCHPDPAVRRRAVAHLVECVQIAKTVGSNLLSLWFADGTNYAGQDDLRTRRRRLVDALAEVYATLPPGMRMLIEYKFFEPAFYHTDLADWGMASAVAARLGPQAEVLVDRRTLAARQTAADVLRAHQILLDAYHTDVRPLLRRAREELRVPADPLDAFRREGHAERLAKARGAKAAGAGYPGA